MRKATAIAYWLIPARPVRELFSEIIRILAEELGAPRFEPHLTLFAAPGSDQSARRLLHRIKAQRIHLAVRDEFRRPPRSVPGDGIGRRELRGRDDDGHRG